MLPIHQVVDVHSNELQQLHVPTANVQCATSVSGHDSYHSDTPRLLPVSFDNMSGNGQHDPNLCPGQSQPSPSPPETGHNTRFAYLFTFTAWKQSPSLIIGILAAILTGVLKTSLSVLLGHIFGVISAYGAGDLTSPDTIDQIQTLCTFMAAIGGAGWFIDFLLMFTWLAFGESQARHARHRILWALLQKDLEWYDRQPSGISSLLVRIHT